MSDKSNVAQDEMQQHFNRAKETHQAIMQPDAATDRAIDQMLSEAKAFHESRHKTRKRLLKVAWTVAGGLGGVCVVQAIALAVMMPLKQTEPIMITTYKDGYAEVIRDFSDAIRFEKEVDEYFLKEYVTNRETYDWNKMQHLVDYTRAWSADHVYNEFYSFVTMPNSALETLKDKARIDARVTSILVNQDAGIATVRITKTPKSADGKAMDGVQPTYWVAELKYHQGVKQAHKFRSYNPFGYQVTSYTLTQDTTR